MSMFLRRLTVAATTVAVGAGALGLATPAEAATNPIEIHCKNANKDEGWLHVYFRYRNGLPRTVTKMTYKIKHGRRTYEPPVTKKNNVNVGDAGVVPVKKTNTGNAWDTNKWRTLSDRDYNRGSGSIGVKFTFDYRFGPDPTCSAHSKVL